MGSSFTKRGISSHRLCPMFVVLSFCLFLLCVSATSEIYPLSLHDALPIWIRTAKTFAWLGTGFPSLLCASPIVTMLRSEEHTSELQSRRELVCRLLLEKKIKLLL